MKLGMEKIVLVSQTTSKLMEFVELATQIQIIMVKTVFVTMDTLEMLINALLVILAVENVKDLMLANV